MFPVWYHHQTSFVYGPDLYENLIPENHIVQYEYDYSDRDMEDAARYHLVIKWFVGLPIEASSFDHTVHWVISEIDLEKKDGKNYST